MMFRRLLWHLLRGNRVRLTVALLALTSGGAVVSALLNLNVDVSRQLSREFRALGANIVIAAPSARASAANALALVDESALQTVQRVAPPDAAVSPYLYVVARAASSGGRDVVVAGTWLDRITQLSPSWKISGDSSFSREDTARCLVGRNAAQNLNLSIGSKLALATQNSIQQLAVNGILDAGGPEDNQIFVDLPVAQKLAAAESKTQLIELSVAGSPSDIRGVQARLQSALPNLTVRPIPQVTEAEGKLLGRIRFLMVSTGLLILVLTALCILAVMAAMAMERRKDVGLMKALGGSMEKILRIFLVEVGILGFTGGVLGYVLGVLLSIWMGRRVFGVSISPRWEVFPLTVALMLIVSLAGALPLRLLGNIRPAVILRSE